MTTSKCSYGVSPQEGSVDQFRLFQVFFRNSQIECRQLDGAITMFFMGLESFNLTTLWTRLKTISDGHFSSECHFLREFHSCLPRCTLRLNQCTGCLKIKCKNWWSWLKNDFLLIFKGKTISSLYQFRLSHLRE